MRRRWLAGTILAVLVLAAGVAAWSVSRGEHRPILVGLLHSQTGAWASTEKSMLEAELRAIEDINAAGGLLGRPVRAVVVDGHFDAPTYARLAYRLIYEDKVSVLIGCWSSEARKAVRPVVEEAQHLLVYPPSYEGMEQSPNIVYPGGPANQQVVPAVSWCCDVRKARKFFLIGSESLWAHAVGERIKDQLHARRLELVGEAYLSASSASVSAPAGDDRDGEGRDALNEAVGQIERSAPDVVLSTVEGRDILAFYGRLKHLGITAETMPVVSFCLDEESVGRLPIGDVVGHYAAWDYLQSIDRPENREFLRKFLDEIGAQRVVCDNFQVAYQSVRLWAETVDEAGTDDVETVNREILRQSLDAPEGVITIDSETRHGWRPFYLGKVRPDGQFEIIWSMPKSIRPVPYPSSRSPAEWDQFIDDLMSGKKGRGSAPAPATKAGRGDVPAD